MLRCAPTAKRRRAIVASPCVTRDVAHTLATLAAAASPLAAFSDEAAALTWLHGDDSEAQA